MQALGHFLCTGSNGTKVSVHYNNIIINIVEYRSWNLLMFIVADTIQTLEIVSEIQGVSMFINYKGGSTVSWKLIVSTSC